MSDLSLSRRHSEAPAHVRTPDVPDCAQERAPHPQLQGGRPARAKVSNILKKMCYIICFHSQQSCRNVLLKYVSFM